MKKILFIIAILFSLPIFSQTAEDKVLAEAKYLLSVKQYHNVVTLLEGKENIVERNPRVLYCLIKARIYILGKQANTDKYDYTMVEELRKDIEKFSVLSKTKKKKIPSDIEAEIADIKQKLSKLPSKEEYLALQRKKAVEEQLKLIYKAYEEDKYDEVLRLIELYNRSDIPAYELAYYKAIAKYYLLLHPETAEFKQIDDVRTLLNVYLEHYSHKNIAYDNNIKEALTILNKYPETEAEFLQMRMEAKREAELYKKANTLFKQLTYNFNYISWEQIDNARKATAEYLLLGIKNNSHYQEIKQNSNVLEDVYPKTEADYYKLKTEATRRENLILKRYDREERREYRKSYWGKFASLGYEGGTIAHGLRFECGGSRSLVGFFVNGRSSFKDNEMLIKFVGTDSFPENKIEFIGGLNFRVFQWAYLNVGAGVGMLSFPSINEYLQIKTIKDKTYTAGYLGVSFRAGTRFNIIGGLSYIDITEKFYTPEVTFGFTINLL
jgi:hypothetical protein